MVCVPLLLLLAAGPAAADSTPDAGAAQKERPKPSLTVESEDPPDSNSRPIRECYEKRLLERPTLQGKLVARFDIGPNGKVIGATADGISDRELILCVLNVVRKFEFERPVSGGKLRIAYPFKFEPRPAR